MTAAFTAGERAVQVTVQYGYHSLFGDVLRFEYWDAAISAWVPWGSIQGSDTLITSNFCTIPKTTYITQVLGIASFTPVQLTGFKYRIFYDDNLTGVGTNYGFCFSSPTIKSITCAAPTSIVASVINATGATVTWDAITGVTGFEYVVDTVNADPTVAGTSTTANSVTLSLTPNIYYFHIRTNCTSSQSPWRTITFTTGVPNDDCANAIGLTVNPNMLCSVKTRGTVRMATASAEPYGGVGNPDDDVWYKFVATATAHRIELSVVSGTGGPMVVQVMGGTCGGGLTNLSILARNISTVRGLVPGNTYYVRIYTFLGNNNPTATFDLCVSTPPPPPANDNCSDAVGLTVNPSLVCTAKTSGTLLSATSSGEPYSGDGVPDDDVWFKFLATGTTHRIELSNIVGSTTNLVHQILDGSCGGGLLNVNTSDPETSTTTGLTPGLTYYVRVFSFGANSSATTTFDLCVATFPPPPANDSCAGAITLGVNADASCTVKTAGNLASATDSGEGDHGVGDPDDDVWFKFVATQPTHKISLTDVTGAPTDLVHELLEGTCGGSLTSKYVSDNDISSVAGLIVGNTYYVRVFTNATGPGSTTAFNVCVGVPPAGSLCQAPIVVNSLPYTTADNTNLYGDDYSFGLAASGCAATSNYFLNGDEVVYAYTPTTNQTINIRIPNAPAWSGMLVYNSCTAVGTGAIACASGETAGNREINNFSVIAGTTYYVILSTLTPQSFAYTLNITANACVLPTATFSTSSNCPATPQFFVNANITSLGSATSLTVSVNQSSPSQQVTATGTVQFGPYPHNTPVTVTITNNQDTGCVITSTPQNRVACPPANDDCANAIALTPTAVFGNVTDGNNLGATASSTETAPITCLGYNGGDIWYKVVVPASGNITIETGNSSSSATGFDSVITVYSGTCGSLVQVGCDDDGANAGGYSKVVLTGQIPGATLYARVYGYDNNDARSFGISAYDASLSTTSFDNANFKAYPNPVDGILNLSYSQNMSDIAIFNLLGQQVLTKTINATESQIDMSNLASGTYLVKVNVNNQVKTLKVVKQ